MKTVEQMTKEIDDMLVSLDSIHLEPTTLNYETKNQDECCCEQQQLSCIQES